MKCTKCNRDINSIGQDNMSDKVNSPICEDCSKGMQIRTDGCPDDCSLCGSYCVYDKK